MTPSINFPNGKEGIRRFLTVDVTFPGWEHTVGLTKSFYVGGVAWFRNTVLPNSTDIKKYAQEAAARLPEIIGDPDGAFDWEEQFSPRQAIDALSLTRRMPVKFVKAITTLAACELAARDRFEKQRFEDPFESPLSRMSIIPAVFYVIDFDHDFSEFLRERPRLLSQLMQDTDQRSRIVFEDMARGKTVTHDLATGTFKALTAMFPDHAFAGVDFRDRPGPLRNLGASLFESLSE